MEPAAFEVSTRIGLTGMPLTRSSFGKFVYALTNELMGFARLSNPENEVGAVVCRSKTRSLFKAVFLSPTPPRTRRG